MDDRSGPDPVLYGIGALARRTGLPVRTIRFWSDSGLVPPARRSAAGHRRYDALALARLELVAALRSLGLGLEAVRAVLEQRTTLAAVAAAHARALETELRLLRVQRAVLVALAARGSGLEEMKMVHDLARLSARERQQLVDEFVADTFGPGPDDSGLGARMRELTPALPDEPSAEQVAAWIEVAELVSDTRFRARVRQMVEAGRSAADGAPLDRTAGRAFATAVTEHAGAALAAGLDPVSDDGERVVRLVLPDASPDKRRQVAEQLATFTDPRVDRYWQLVGVINGWPPQPPSTPPFEWFLAALRAHPGEAPVRQGRTSP